MKSASIYCKNDLRIEDKEVPEPAVGQIRLRVKYVGICGSDLHYYFFGANGPNFVKEPLVPGHELSAVVDKDPTGGILPGTAVTVHPARWGEPIDYLGGKPHLWPNGDYLGSAASVPHRQGAAQEYLIVDEHMLRMIPDGLDLRKAALAEPLAVALHAIRLAGDIKGKRILVSGVGPIGLLVTAAALEAGAAIAGVRDIRREPIDRAYALGATEHSLSGVDEVANDSYDIVFECSGAGIALSEALQAVRPGGVIVQVGMLPDTEIKINLSALLSKEVRIYGALRFINEIDEAIVALNESTLYDSVISHVLPMSEVQKAFDIARDSSASAKVLLSL